MLFQHSLPFHSSLWRSFLFSPVDLLSCKVFVNFLQRQEVFHVSLLRLVLKLFYVSTRCGSERLQLTSACLWWRFSEGLLHVGGSHFHSMWTLTSPRSLNKHRLLQNITWLLGVLWSVLRVLARVIKGFARINKKGFSTFILMLFALFIFMCFHLNFTLTSDRTANPTKGQ